MQVVGGFCLSMRGISIMNDLTFFTNEPDATLLERFRSTLTDTQFFDVLVGYFRTSGFHLLYDAFEDIEKIRILIGLNIDHKAFEIIEEHRTQTRMDFQSSKRTKEVVSESIAAEMEHSPDTYQTELGVSKFIEFLNSGKLEIKAHPSQSIHAKVYISRFPEDDRDFGRVITGSSNFSHSGLQGNYEFNVELKNSVDVKFALDKFEILWKEAVDISEAYVDTIHRRTWLNDTITPYELYLKFLYEYFKEDINIDQATDVYLPEGFLDLAYQKQAMASARKILEAYNGVFLADVVGLGKTFVSALLAQQLPGRKLVICPPVLKDYWRQTFYEFGIGGTIFESMGKLDAILEMRHDRFDYIFIDEAHRFRNEGTQGYAKLHEICWGKKIILVSATPLNNTVQDIFSQLKLFQVPRKSTIPGVRNLEAFFRKRRTRTSKAAKEFGKGSQEYIDVVKEIAGEVREKILKDVMVRRTRNEIMRYYAQDIKEQGLSFPKLADPQRVVYQFNNEIELVFNTTIQKLRQFRYARYTPLLYLRKKLTAFEAQQQRNVGGFMKGILVKRLESSFFAFKNTLRRFIESYEHFIQMFDDGSVWIGKDINIYDLLERDDDEEIARLVDEDRLRQYASDAFGPSLRKNLQADLELLREIQSLWIDINDDPKLDQFVHELKENPLLKGRKLIVFTESSETGQYLCEHLEKHFPKKVLFYSSQGGIYAGDSIGKARARQLVRSGYDPAYEGKKTDEKILISTDVLAEGINLHRANIVINYDLPWNPTRVLQRVGRVNRVGTLFQEIYIFNFFPTSQSDEHLGLENNIKAKIQAFHDTLGEDAKYLTEEEDVSQHELFGDHLYSALARKESYTGEEEDESELKYLQVIRDVRDNDEDLFDKVKKLPKKARSGHRTSELSAALVSFFRRDRLKKFYLAAENEDPVELTFMQAVDWLRCEPDTPRLPIPQKYYDLLKENKKVFAEATTFEDEETKKGGNRSNVNYIIHYLKAIRQARKFTDDEDAYLLEVQKTFEKGIVPKGTSRELRKKLEEETDPLKAMGIIKANIPKTILFGHQDETEQTAPLEVILSLYLAQNE